ncbi:Guanine nucleotide-binding protein G(I)/G(S)/G(T) subunit beta-3 [Hypsizygus marmoreus]|uniref:Guanine nucleotide-binding protein G(I)/G(S)/G(T) subunit beta-3 n=1 Tax=Hypsizygus marmoreus TaxID=39966 RepID=A0A369JLM2_HYPMA|nr:Guanine nucleotide-binding protein G(I)/G(S)/G(T) subunit beta-3 [Hypsizygus marmoreus]
MPRISSNNVYKIVNIQSGTALTALQRDSIIGSPYSAANVNYQKWTVMPAGPSDLYYLKTYSSDSYLAVAGGRSERLVIEYAKFSWNIVPDDDAETKFRNVLPLGSGLCIPEKQANAPVSYRIFQNGADEEMVVQLGGGSSSAATVRLAPLRYDLLNQVWKFEIADQPPPPTPPPPPPPRRRTLLGAVANRRTVRLWDPRSGELVHTVDINVWTTQLVSLQHLGEHVGFMNSSRANLFVRNFLKPHADPRTVGFFDLERQEFVELSPKGHYLVAANSKEVIVFNGLKPQVMQVLSPTLRYEPRVARFRDDDKYLAIGFHGSVITVWNTQTWAKRSMIMPDAPGKTGYPVLGLAWAPSFTDALLTSRLFDQTLILWNTNNGTQIRSFFTHHSFQLSRMSFFPDDRQLKVAIAGGPDASQPEYRQPQKGMIQIWRLLDYTQSPIRTITYGDHAFVRVDVSPDGNLITASQDKFHEVNVWDANTYRRIQKIKNDGTELEHLGFTEFSA